MPEYAYFAYYDLITRLARELSDANTSPIHYLEIGTQEGGSANAAFESHCIGLAVLVDTWGVEYGGSGRNSPQHVVERLGPDRMRKTLIITGSSSQVIPTLLHKFDLIFVDGDHSEVGCLTDMTNCLPLLAPGGVMLVDDQDHPAHSYIRGITDKFAADNQLSINRHALTFGVAELRKIQ